LCPPYLYTVATLLGKSRKIIFQQYYSYARQIIYVFSEENKQIPLIPTTPEKCHHTTLQNAKLLHLTAGNVAFLQMLVALWVGYEINKMTDQRDKKTDHRIGQCR